jgi:hypothetical protein
MLELRVPGQRRRYGEVEKLEVWRYWCSGGVVQWRLEGVEEWRRVCRVWVFP